MATKKPAAEECQPGTMPATVAIDGKLVPEAISYLSAVGAVFSFVLCENTKYTGGLREWLDQISHKLETAAFPSCSTLSDDERDRDPIMVEIQGPRA